jgi:membrane fusion protein, copper/silver efflux system
MKRLMVLVLAVGLAGAGFLAGVGVMWHSSKAGRSSTSPQALYYACPMHPQYHSNKSGDCPSCGMRLEPVFADTGPGAAGPAPPPGVLSVPADRQQLIGVGTATVEIGRVNRTIRTVGKVAVDENRVYRLVATAEGIVRVLHPFAAGSLVRREEPLLSFYSSEFLTAQQAYFYALTTLERVSKDPTEINEQVIATNAQLRSAVDALRNLGLSERQIVELGKTRRLTREIELRSPVTGYVLSRAVFPDQRLERSEELYRIADLSRVWVLADLFEQDVQHFQPGATAAVSIPYRAGSSRRARVTEALPQVDPVTRTLKVRLELENADLSLRPDMFVDVTLDVIQPDTVTIPAAAIVDAGTRKTVFVDRGNGFFEPRRVETGRRFDDRIEVANGLMPGERIVVSGNFLLDSESRLKTGVAAAAAQETDLVCGMEVDPGKARAGGRFTVRAGETYYFCSDECKRRFDTAPETFIRKVAPQAPPVATRPPPPQPRAVAPPAGPAEPDPVTSRLRQAERTMNMTAADAAGRTVFATDLVCGAEVDTTDPTTPRSTFQGRTFYFITPECKAAFDKDPAKYVKTPAPMSCP